PPPRTEPDTTRYPISPQVSHPKPSQLRASTKVSFGGRVSITLPSALSFSVGEVWRGYRQLHRSTQDPRKRLRQLGRPRRHNRRSSTKAQPIERLLRQPFHRRRTFIRPNSSPRIRP